MKTGSRDRGRYFYQSLISILEPDLGRNMAVNTVTKYCSELGIKESSINEEHIDLLATKLHKGLGTFISKPRLSSLLKQVKKVKEYDDWGIL